MQRAKRLARREKGIAATDYQPDADYRALGESGRLRLKVFGSYGCADPLDRSAPTDVRAFHEGTLANGLTPAGCLEDAREGYFDEGGEAGRAALVTGADAARLWSNTVPPPFVAASLAAEAREREEAAGRSDARNREKAARDAAARVALAAKKQALQTANAERLANQAAMLQAARAARDAWEAGGREGPEPPLPSFVAPPKPPPPARDPKLSPTPGSMRFAASAYPLRSPPPPEGTFGVIRLRLNPHHHHGGDLTTIPPPGSGPGAPAPPRTAATAAYQSPGGGGGGFAVPQQRVASPAGRSPGAGGPPVAEGVFVVLQRITTHTLVLQMARNVAYAENVLTQHGVAPGDAHSRAYFRKALHARVPAAMQAEAEAQALYAQSHAAQAHAYPQAYAHPYAHPPAQDYAHPPAQAYAPAHVLQPMHWQQQPQWQQHGAGGAFSPAAAAAGPGAWAGGAPHGAQ